MTPCVLWEGTLDRDGYGKKAGTLAHRLAYVAARGPIPAGLEIDHLCRVRACVNPDHLEAVTKAENQRRGIRATATACIHGHPFTPENTIRRRRGGRDCRECGRRQQRAYYRRRKVA